MDLSSELAALLGALIGALTTLAAGLLAYRVGVGRIKAETRAANRKQWMNRTFETLTDLIVTCEHVPTDRAKLTRSLVELELLLNPEEKGDKKAEVLQARQDLILHLRELGRSSRSGDPEELCAQIEERRPTMVALAKRILAEEWRLLRALK